LRDADPVAGLYRQSMRPTNRPMVPFEDILRRGTVADESNQGCAEPT
jgi:hypothetical protein